MATRYEYYEAGGDGDWRVDSDRYVAQLFTPATDHKITSVKLYGKRAGAPGTVTVQIQGVSGGHPDGIPIASATFDGGGWGTAIAWHEISLGDGAVLAASTQYALFVKAPDGNATNAIFLRYDSDGSGGGYAGGNWEYSLNAGVDWTSLAAYDGYFEEWGLPLELAVTIQPMTDIVLPNAKAHGTIVMLGVPPCTQHGHCWSTSPNPTIADDKTELGAGAEGTFESPLTDLLAATTYYVRAYAIDGDGTVYSAEESFIRYGPWVDEAELPFAPTGRLYFSPIVQDVVYIIDNGTNFCKYDLRTRAFTVLNSPTYNIGTNFCRNLVISPDGLKIACVSEAADSYRGGRRIEIYTIAGNSWIASSQVQNMEGAETVVAGLVWADNDTIWTWASRATVAVKTYARCIKYVLSTDIFTIYATLLNGGLTYCQPVSAGINAAGTIIYGNRIGANAYQWYKYTIASDSYALGGQLTAGRTFAIATELGGDKLWYVTEADYRQGYLKISDETEYDDRFPENSDRTATYGLDFGVMDNLRKIIAHARESEDGGTELMSYCPRVGGLNPALVELLE